MKKSDTDRARDRERKRERKRAEIERKREREGELKKTERKTGVYIYQTIRNSKITHRITLRANLISFLSGQK